MFFSTNTKLIISGLIFSIKPRFLFWVSGTALLLALTYLLSRGPYSTSLRHESCHTTRENREVRNRSLTGIIEEGEIVSIEFGFYNCQEVKRGDIVAYNYAGNKNPIIKVVFGVPGDQFRLADTGSRWRILINGKILTNAQSVPYEISENGYSVLSLYERDYRGMIPPNAYLILGNLPTGSLDSSQFGLIDKSDILGRVLR